MSCSKKDKKNLVPFLFLLQDNSYSCWLCFGPPCIHDIYIERERKKREREKERERKRLKTIHTSSWSEPSKLSFVFLDKNSTKTMVQKMGQKKTSAKSVSRLIVYYQHQSPKVNRRISKDLSLSKKICIYVLFLILACRYTFYTK